MKQRLRLASVSPRLLELYGDDQMKLGQVMAFSITKDHARQEQVWETISRTQSTDPYYIRRLLTETAVRAGDRRAVYVGIDAYETAGGIVCGISSSRTTADGSRIGVARTARVGKVDGRR